MKKLKYILMKRLLYIITVIAIVVASCSKWLDEPEPGDQLITDTYLNSVEDLERLLTGAYASMLGDDGRGMAGSSFLVPVLNSDFVKPVAANKATIPDDLMDLYLRRNSTQAKGSYAYDLIKYTSRAINNVNLVIDVLENGSLEDDPDFEELSTRMLGEAYMLRAMANFEQTRLLGKQYNTSTSSSDLAGLYPLKPVLNPEELPSSRVTVAEAYNRMISDLKTAITKLPERYDASTHARTYGTRRVNKDAARALLAKVYFQQNDFTNTIAVINELLGNTAGDSPKYPLDDIGNLKNNIFGLSDGNAYVPNTSQVNKTSELIFDFYGASKENGPNLSDNNHTWGQYFTSSKAWFAMSDTFMDYTGFNSRKTITNKTIQDKRGIYFIDTVEIISGSDTNAYYFPKKFEKPKVNITWYRSAEFLLIRAECYIRTNDESSAEDDLNAIRIRAGLTDFGLDSYDWNDIDNNDTIEVTKDQLKTVMEGIKMERARELFMEKYRTWDMIRLGAFGEGKVPQGNRTVANGELLYGDLSGIVWDSENWVFSYELMKQ
jgi:hypothetical protein